MFCRACGAHLDDNAKFCDKCGKETGKEIKRDDELVVEKVMKKIKKNVATESKAVVEVVKENRVILVKALRITMVVVAVIIICVALGSGLRTRQCDWCGNNSRGDFYYDPYDTDSIMCEKCAMGYFGGFPFEDYKVR